MSAYGYKEISGTLVEKLSPDFNFLVVTATKLEHQVLHEHLKPIKGQTEILQVAAGKQTYFLGVFGVYNVIHVACGEMGAISATGSIVTTLDAINAWKPKVVLMVGIAFGADIKKQRIGDVLVSEEVYNYETRRLSLDQEIPRGKHGNPSSLLVNRFKSIKGWQHLIEGRPADIRFGLILSGEKLVDDPVMKAKLIQEQPTAIGGEMEGSGLYAACDGKVNDWILVKGVCDYADGNKNENKDKYQDQAVRAAVSLCERVFSSPFGFQEVGLHVPENAIDLELLEQRSETIVDGLPVWMRTRAAALKKELES